MVGARRNAPSNCATGTDCSGELELVGALPVSRASISAPECAPLLRLALSSPVPRFSRDMTTVRTAPDVARLMDAGACQRGCSGESMGETLTAPLRSKKKLRGEVRGVLAVLVGAVAGQGEAGGGASCHSEGQTTREGKCLGRVPLLAGRRSANVAHDSHSGFLFLLLFFFIF
jgi:hypothetical protein